VTENLIVIMHILFEIKNPTAFSATGQTMIENLVPENLQKNLLLAKLPWIEKGTSNSSKIRTTQNYESKRSICILKLITHVYFR
jgi:hypothetical protein